MNPYAISSALLELVLRAPAEPLLFGPGDLLAPRAVACRKTSATYARTRRHSYCHPARVPAFGELGIAAAGAAGRAGQALPEHFARTVLRCEAKRHHRQQRNLAAVAAGGMRA